MYTDVNSESLQISHQLKGPTNETKISILQILQIGSARIGPLNILWFRIRGDIHNWKSTPRYEQCGESLR